MERIAPDILGELPKVNGGNWYILVISDYFTKLTEAHPMPHQGYQGLSFPLDNQIYMRLPWCSFSF
jgi:hypothetical protein